jgi:hypothetical protein
VAEQPDCPSKSQVDKAGSSIRKYRHGDLTGLTPVEAGNKFLRAVEVLFAYRAAH